MRSAGTDAPLGTRAATRLHARLGRGGPAVGGRGPPRPDPGRVERPTAPPPPHPPPHAASGDRPSRLDEPDPGRPGGRGGYRGAARLSSRPRLRAARGEIERGRRPDRTPEWRLERLGEALARLLVAQGAIEKVGIGQAVVAR